MKKVFCSLIIVLFMFCNIGCSGSNDYSDKIFDLMHTDERTMNGINRFSFMFAKKFPNWKGEKEQINLRVAEYAIYPYLDLNHETIFKDNSNLILYEISFSNVIRLHFYFQEESDIPETLEITLTRTDKGEEIAEQYTLDFTQKPKFS